MSKVHEIDYFILGVGFVGLQLVYFLQCSGRDYVVLDGVDQVGAFFSRYSWYRILLSINKIVIGRTDPEFNLRHDWNLLISDDPTLCVA